MSNKKKPATTETAQPTRDETPMEAIYSQVRAMEMMADSYKKRAETEGRWAREAIDSFLNGQRKTVDENAARQLAVSIEASAQAQLCAETAQSLRATMAVIARTATDWNIQYHVNSYVEFKFGDTWFAGTVIAKVDGSVTCTDEPSVVNVVITNPDNIRRYQVK